MKASNCAKPCGKPLVFRIKRSRLLRRNGRALYIDSVALLRRNGRADA